jgi:L-galactose dehydrogenase/L-glyceraldehyde 3-phosphate reductase
LEYRKFGKTDLDISVLGFGCGAVGGLMVRGEHKEMLKTVEFALDAGMNYFDTARAYGDGLSEIHLGALLRELGSPNVIIGTKVKLNKEHSGSIQNEVSEQINNSLKRLGAESVDIVYTHNRITDDSLENSGDLNQSDMEDVVIAFEKAVFEGKIRYWGFNGLGSTASVTDTIKQFSPAGIHTCYNLLNPSAGEPISTKFPYQDYDSVIDKCNLTGIGTVAIRILAGGALTGSSERHPISALEVAPISTGKSMKDDVSQSLNYSFLVDEGYVESLSEAAIRFAVTNEKVHTALIGLSNLNHLEYAVNAVEKGPLEEEVLGKIATARKEIFS